jgi:Flp pilus assembly protein CpaB
VKKPLLFALVGLALGSLGALRYAALIEERASGGQPEALLIVNKDLARGTVLTPDALEVTQVPESYVDGRRVLAQEKESVLGMPVAVALRAGEGLYWTDISGGELGRVHLADAVPAGRRAYQLGQATNPLGALVEAGDLVDVLCAGAGDGRTVLERVLVLAVGDRLRRSDELGKAEAVRGGGLSLSVLPEEAETLVRAERGCQLRILLRSPEDIALRGTGSQDSRAAPGDLATLPREIERVR